MRLDRDDLADHHAVQRRGHGSIIHLQAGQGELARRHLWRRNRIGTQFLSQR
jgi:hypothetical protein